MSRKIVVKVILILLFTFLLAGSLLLLHFHSEKKEVTEKVDKYLQEKDYQNNVKNETTSYDTKEGKYYVKVIFKDEPNNYYEIYIDDPSEISVIGYNSDNGQITDKSEGKYITEP